MREREGNWKDKSERERDELKVRLFECVRET